VCVHITLYHHYGTLDSPPERISLFIQIISCLNYHSFILVNENSSIRYLLFLFCSIFFTNVYVNSQLDILYACSTHLHGIISDELLWKIHTKLFLQVPKIEDSRKMEFSKEFILTPYNYFAWKENMIMHLRSRGLYRLTMNIEIEPTSSIEKSKYLNRMDEAFGTTCSLISPKLLFHISSCKTPNEAWTTMEIIFGKQDEIRGHFLEVEFLTLDQKLFDNLQDFFTKYKDLLSQLKACGVDKYKEEKKMVLTILSKLVPEYSVFISSFH
jgi:hypothetical protein